MRSKWNSGGRIASLWFAALLAATVASASSSCGGQKNSGFPAGSSSGDLGNEEGGSDDSGLCLVPPCGIPFDDATIGPLPGADGGQVKVDAGVSIDECTGKLAAATVTSLEAGGPVDPAMKWLYPYDQTVFPGDLLPPVLQWSAQSGGADGVYVHLKSQLFEYKGCFGKTSPTNLALASDAWAGAWNQSNGSTDPLSVEITTIAGGTVSGPITEHWIFALGSLKGVIYYNTYTSPQANNNGAVMVVKPGAAAPTLVLAITGTSPFGPCISCHSLSADGSMLVAQKHLYPGGLTSPGSMSFSLANGATIDAMNPVPLASDDMDDWGFSAVYPDGSRLLACGESQMTGGIFPAAQGNNPGMVGPKSDVMFDTKTGAAITVSGLAVKYAMMPMFSPDGTKIVFNDYDNGTGHSLMVQDFDAATNTFSNPKSIYKSTTGYPGWPFFTPDSASVVFALNAPGTPETGQTLDPGSNFASLKAPPLQAAATDINNGDLYIVSLATGTAVPMDEANWYHGSPATSYMPYPGRDEHYNFYPTVSPVAAGGYFWAFFTSRRQYGNVMADSSGAVPDPVFNTETKKIWVSAISIEANGDPSHPAFYLPGQEAPSGNIRAFAALAPCIANGATCTSGIDCCGGYCTNGTCSKPATCSTVDNKCTTTADCCMGLGLMCIGGFCSTVVQ